ncbi:MAG: RNA methyltransferase [Verrucomicrobiales bacterium]|jgi:tRNA (guanosine-2'-O-)-methyltransferase|nr:RNA methyltransferase [Verrucomicrobiales bacterium]
MNADAELIAFLGDYVTENKQQKIAEVLRQRTRHFTVLLEDIYQPHNASACLRSCDCLGIQDVHIVEDRNRYRPNNGVTMGSTKWLSLQRYHDTAPAIETLRSRGYRLVATTPNVDGFEPATLPLDQPIALLFGTEEEGLSEEALDAADTTLRLPMYGFTQSYNISVTVALTLSRLTERLRESEIDWHLTEEEQSKLTLEFYRRIVKRHDLLERQFWDQQETEPSKRN